MGRIRLILVDSIELSPLGGVEEAARPAFPPWSRNAGLGEGVGPVTPPAEQQGGDRVHTERR